MDKPADFAAAIDWTRPWLAPYRQPAAPLLQSPDRLAALNRCAADAGLHNHAGLPLRFVPQAELPPGVPYEAFISSTGCVPTRDNLHDFFNALAWLRFPRIKTELNRLQAEQIAKLGVGRLRGPARDAATIFDENAALLVTRDPALGPALRAHDWYGALAARKESFRSDAEIRLFGHALLEKLVTPYKAITAHAWITAADDAFFALDADGKDAWIDLRLQSLLAGQPLTTAGFTPLPVLGVPGWWPGQDLAFYSDRTVFRPARIQD
jgi:hypothetical protein